LTARSARSVAAAEDLLSAVARYSKLRRAERGAYELLGFGTGGLDPANKTRNVRRAAECFGESLR
jgi:hypothetical protein